MINIFNNRRTIYLFKRDANGNQRIETVNNFHPYYYEPISNNQEPTYRSYDNKPLRKVIVSEPSEVSKLRSSESYEADILFTKRFVIDRIDKISDTPLKYLFIDIEVLAKELPEANKAEYPVSCISIYNSFTKNITQFILTDYDNDEEALLLDFVEYMKIEKPDLWFSWNVKFDYNYLYHRIENFSSKISPINQSRYGEEDILYPAGIGILDYLSLFRKVYGREKSYALDHIAQKYLDEKSWGKSDFGILTQNVIDKNKNDVLRMIKLEDKFQLINYYNQVRILTKCLWEDLYFNGRIVEMLILEEAKNKKVVLPNNKKDKEKGEFKGAIRDLARNGVFENISKYDLSSCYPNAIINFNLDSSNIVSNLGKDVINVNNVYFKQDTNALLPSAVTRILKLKQDLGSLKKKTSKDDINYKSICQRYDGIKGIVNSCFGVFGNEYFRLYDNRIASSITFLARDLLSYVMERLKEKRYEVIYYDTDGIFIESKENLTDMMNSLIQEWGKIKYNKENISITFEREGLFINLFILGKCHYYGILEGHNEPEIKGIESKRSNSSKFEGIFQTTLLDKVLKKETKENIIKWIQEEKQRIKQVSLLDIAPACKIQNREYKTTVTRATGKSYDKGLPIFIRAYENTKIIKSDFDIKKGELFYYIYINSLGKDKKGKDIDVLAIKDDDYNFVSKDKVNWDEMIRRNILLKVDPIFEALEWNLDLELSNQKVLF